ncbi:MAG: helix-turn-helix transcriptional regulator [Oscillospiraceae bacterium]
MEKLKKDINQEQLLIFCKNIKNLRKREKLTQREMSDILGIGLKSLEKLEKGLIPARLSIETLFKASIYFKYAVKDLFSDI